MAATTHVSDPGRRRPAGGRDPLTRRIGRVLNIIQHIAREPGVWSRRKLAQHYEISERMITQDLEQIKYQLGMALTHDGRAYSFERVPRLPQAGLSFGEALALLLAAQAAQAIPGVDSADLAAAIARLEAMFPAEIQPLLRQAEALPRRAGRSQRGEMLQVLHRGWMERRPVAIAYATASRGGEVGRRIVEPYCILPYGRSWQLVAFDHKRGEVREFKVDRVQGAEVLEGSYCIPADFDVDEYLGDGWGLMRGAAGPAEAVSLLFEPEAGRWAAEERWHASQRHELLPDGRVRLRFHVGVTPEMVSWLLYYGPRVTVEAPEWLRDRVRAEHRKAAEGGG